VYAYSYNPAVFTGATDVPAGYQSFCQASQFELVPTWVTLFSAMFLHGGILHIASNMLFLFVFGDNVEDKLGHFPYLLFYLFCGLVASFAQTAVGPAIDIPNLGASGAVAGVLGAYLVLFPKANVRTLVFLGIIFFFTTISASILIIIWFGLQLLNGVLSINSAAAEGGGVAYFAHIGGFVAGLLIIFLIRSRLPKDDNRYLHTYRAPQRSPWSNYR
jgi:membrane associated rhomboid family serine protease